jgi:spermidine synthase
VTEAPVVLERVTTPRGELVLRRSGDHLEVISNGTFLMDTRGGDSERLLVSAAFEVHGDPQRVLIGGLGVGFSLATALADHRVREVVVVEIEPALLAWHRSHLAPWSSGVLDDARTTVVVSDIADHLRETKRAYDVICLDVDNGPDWTVTPDNAALYDDPGISQFISRLPPGGVFAAWSATRPTTYEAALRRHFAAVQVHEIDVPTGPPDVVLIATGRPIAPDQ